MISLTPSSNLSEREYFGRCILLLRGSSWGTGFFEEPRSNSNLRRMVLGLLLSWTTLCMRTFAPLTSVHLELDHLLAVTMYGVVAIYALLREVSLAWLHTPRVT